MRSVRNQDHYEEVPFPKVRQPLIDCISQAKHTNIIHFLLEVDVTETRRWQREFGEKIGEPLSFTSFLTYCLARAVDENKLLQAYRKGSKLIVYDQVDISIIMEREIGDEKVPIFPHVVKSANRKSLTEIHKEIREAQGEDKNSSQMTTRFNQYYYIPGFIRALYWRWQLNSPAYRNKVTGTVAISSIGMFGNGTGWGIPIPAYNLGITVGSIATKPGVINGQVTPREYLHLTASFNHDTIDGAPAARFTQRLKDLIESGYGLHD